VIASAGCQVDMKALQKLLQARNVMFQHNHGKPMSCKGAAQLLSNTLYYKRFFPYYTFNLCAGLDEEGEHAILHYVTYIVVITVLQNKLQKILKQWFVCCTVDLDWNRRVSSTCCIAYIIALHASLVLMMMQHIVYYQRHMQPVIRLLAVFGKATVDYLHAFFDSTTT
jgi:hypothetical protein